jgi:hypothetical protein
MFTIILSKNYPKISGKIGFTIEEKAFLLERYFQNRVNRQPIERLCIASIIMRTIKVRQTFQ